MKKFLNVIYILVAIVAIGTGALAMMPMMAEGDLDTTLYTEITSEQAPTETMSVERDNLIQAVPAVSDSMMPQTQTFTYEVAVDEAGTYRVLVDVKRQADTKVLNNAIELSINGEQYSNKESEKVTFDDDYIYPYIQEKFSKGQKEIVSTAVIPTNWQQVYLTDKALNHMVLEVVLEAGKNTIALTRTSGEIEVGDLYVQKVEALPTYKTYSDKYQGEPKGTGTYFVRGEDFAYKNNITINPEYDNSLKVTPNSLDTKYLNVVGNGNFNKHTDKITYLIEVPESGLYKLGFGYKTDTGQTGARKNVPVYVNLYVNGHVPFQEFEGYKLPYAKDYATFVTEEYVYLEAGTNTLSIQMNQTNIDAVHEGIKTITDEISDTALEIKKITNGVVDKNRTWNMGEYLPELESQLQGYITDLQQVTAYLMDIYGNNENEECLNIEMSIFQLERILEDIDNLPNEMNLLSEGSASVLGKLGSVLSGIVKTDLSVDTVYLTNDGSKLPTGETNMLHSYQKGVKELVNSFNPQTEQGEEVLDLWVRRPKQNFDIMQQLIDEQFTEETGIEVNMSMLKADDQTKLTLANAAGTGPDVVTGLDAYYVSDIGQRGAIEDLTDYPGIEAQVEALSTGAMMQVYVEDAIYGLSETQDVFVAAYRTDLFDDLGLEPAETWDDVEMISSVLRRNGMQVYLPLSQAGAFKPYTATAPFIFQNNADIFTEDGMGTVFGTENGMKAFEQMTDLFSIYGVGLNIESVYQSFRDGDVGYAVMPINEYLKLYFSAPELAGRWSVHRTPGTVQEDGTIDRTTGGSGTMLAMMKSSDQKDAAWTFIEWWLQPEVQTEYMNRLLNTYGDEYLFVSANAEVIETLPLPEAHKAAIIEQLQYASEVQRLPGGYVVEREISNAWNNIVLNGKDVRSAVEEATRLSDKEIQRKMKEFGYVDVDGNMLMPYQVNTKEDLEEWVKRGE